MVSRILIWRRLNNIKFTELLENHYIFALLSYISKTTQWLTDIVNAYVVSVDLVLKCLNGHNKRPCLQGPFTKSKRSFVFLSMFYVFSFILTYQDNENQQFHWSISNNDNYSKYISIFIDKKIKCIPGIYFSTLAWLIDRLLIIGLLSWLIEYGKFNFLTKSKRQLLENLFSR